MKINHLVLASTSPYRRALLNQIGLNHAAMAPETDEDSVEAENPKALAQARAEAKGLGLPHGSEAFLAIAADQVLDFQGEAYGKAPDEASARARLKVFAGQTHTLHSAYSLTLYSQGRSEILVSRVVSAQLTMLKLSDAEIAAYVATGEWKGCAGCYQYENRGLHLFEKLEGDLSTVIGLPLPQLLADLRSLGIHPLLQPEGPWSLTR